MCLYMFKGPMCSVHQLISEVQVKSSMSINSISVEKSERVGQIWIRNNTRGRPGIITQYTAKAQKAALMAKG